TAPRKGEDNSALVRVVTPGYIGAMGIRLRSGRDFTWHDGPASERAVIVNQAAARRFWPSEDAVGKFAVINQTDFRVIGVIADVRQHSLETTAGPEMYLAATQADPEGAELVVRTKLPIDAVGS